jgi:hypothetical protein
MDGREGNPELLFNGALQVSNEVHSLRSLVMEGYEIAVLKIDPAAVERMVNAAR